MVSATMTFGEVFSSYEETYSNGNVIFNGTLRLEHERVGNARLTRFITGFAPITPIVFERAGLSVKCMFRYKVMYDKEYVPDKNKVTKSTMDKARAYRTKGMSYRDIGKELGISHDAAFQIVNRKGSYA